MSKNDINSLGSVYGGMLNGLKKDLIKEGKVGPSEIGDADLLDGGPTKEGGFTEPEVDIEKLSDKEREDNLYNINNLSYTNSYMPEEDEEGKHDDKDGKKEKCDYVDCEEDKEDEEDAEEKMDLMNAFDKGTDPEDKDTDEDKLIDKKLFDDEEDEERSDGTDDGECEECGGLGCEPCNGTGEKSEENEESLEITEKIARDSLNNFMSKKSYFDKLYENVMGADFEENDMTGAEELDALGIDDSSDGDEVTVTLPRDVAQTLCDMLKSACGDDAEDGDEAGIEVADYDEDEEDTGSAMSTAYDDGKSNKVGNLKTQSGASSDVTDKVGNDGDHGHALVNAKAANVGTNNKVGNLKAGKSAFDK